MCGGPVAEMLTTNSAAPSRTALSPRCVRGAGSRPLPSPPSAAAPVESTTDAQPPRPPPPPPSPSTRPAGLAGLPALRPSRLGPIRARPAAHRAPRAPDRPWRSACGRPAVPGIPPWRTCHVSGPTVCRMCTSTASKMASATTCGGHRHIFFMYIYYIYIILKVYCVCAYTASKMPCATTCGGHRAWPVIGRSTVASDRAIDGG